MATPTLVGIGSTSVGATSSSVTVGWPAGLQAGDYAILCIETARNASTPSTPSGWSLIRLESSPADPEGAKVKVCGRYLPSGTMADVTVSGSMHLSACIAVFRGVDADLAYESSSTSYADSATSTTVPAFAALSSSGDDRLLFYAVATGAPGSYVSGVGSGPAVTVARASGHSSFDGGGISVLVGASAIGAGTVAANSVSFNTSTDSASAHFLLRPKPVAAIAGGASFVVSGDATGRRIVNGSATSACTVEGSAQLSGSAALEASTNASLSPAGSLRGAGVLSGLVAFGIVAAGAAGGSAALSGAAAFGATQSALAAGKGQVSGLCSVALSGSASGSEIPGLGGYGAIGLTGAGGIGGSGALSGVSTSALTWAASLSGLLPAQGGAAFGAAGAGSCAGTARASGLLQLQVEAAAIPSGAGSVEASLQFVFDASASLRGIGTLQVSGASSFGMVGSGQGLTIADPVVQEHWRVPSSRKVLLLTIGAPPLPVITPIEFVEGTLDIDPHEAPQLAGPDSLTVVAGLDSAYLAWAYLGPKGAEFVVEVAPDVDGAAGDWAVGGTTADLQYLLGGLTSGAVWVRVYATLNGRDSSPAPAQQVTPIPSLQVTGNTSAIASLQDSVELIDGVLTAHATDLVNLAARADAVENDVGGLQTETAALADADSELEARVTAAEGSITAQSSQITSLSSSLDITKSVSGRTPLVFRQTSAPTPGGTRYNKLLQTDQMYSSPWLRTAGVVGSAVGDPEGNLVAFRVTPTGDGQYVRQDVSGLGSIAGRTFCYPVWIRADTAHTCSIRLVAGTAGTSEVVHVAASNFWQRVNITHEFGAETDTSLRVEIYPKQYGSTGQPNLSIDVFGPQLNEGPVRPYQRVGVANDFDGNGIPPLSTWYDTDDGNKQYTWTLNGGSMQWVVGGDARIAATAAATSALDTRVTAAEGTITAQAAQITTLNASLDGKASASAVSMLEARVTETEDGLLSYFAAFTIELDVNGKISGFRSVNDGTTSSFEVSADVFSVTASAGADALTWRGGVISTRKGSKELKLGPGYGSDASGKKLLLSYGAPVADGSASRATADMWIAENGDNKLGAFQVNYGSGWKSGAAVTYSASAGTPATATISVTAGVFAIGGREYSYSASSASVSGTGGTSATYWLYYDDPGLLAGSRTLYATTDGTVSYNSDSKVIVGAVKVTFPSSGSSSGGGSTPGGGSGGGGGGVGCVSTRAWVIGRAGLMRAGDVRVGEDLLLCDPATGQECWGTVTHSRLATVPGVRVMAGAAELTCSTTAPIPTECGFLLAPDLAGHDVLSRGPGAARARTVDSVSDAGVIDVQHITVGDRCFWAGDDGVHFLLHHNLKAPLPDNP